MKLPRAIDPRLTNVIATAALGVLALTALVVAGVMAWADAPGEVVIACLGVASTALAGLAPSPVQRPGA